MTHSDEYSIVVVKLATKRPKHRRKDITKTNVKGVGCDGIYRNQVRLDYTNYRPLCLWQCECFFCIMLAFIFLYLRENYFLENALFQFTCQQYYHEGMRKEDNRIRLQTIASNSSNRRYLQRKAVRFPSPITVVSRTTCLFIITGCAVFLQTS
jgi:hypothetical protein